MSGSSAKRVVVLYFAGSGRSGTTIINTILGQIPGVFAAGELRYVWSRGVVEDHRCGCGEPFSTCPVWTSVMNQVGGSTPAEATAIARRLLDRLRVMKVPAMIVRRATGRPGVRRHSDDDRIVALYQAIAEHTGANVIVDSSKLPPYGLLLAQRPELDVRVLHVVRDPRATAFSWRRTKATHDTAEVSVMPRMEVWKSSLLWTLWNLLAALWWPLRGGRAARFRYEDFVTAPRRHMAEVTALVGLDADALPFVSGDAIKLGPTHSVAGNPNRHATGTVRITGDIEWRTAMSTRDRLIVTALSAAGIARFRYPWAVRSARTTSNA